MNKVSQTDEKHYQLIRANVSNFLKSSAKKFDSASTTVLDIAPQVHEGASAYFFTSTVSTIDIDPKADCTFHADICRNNRDLIPDDNYSVIVCTEVLEHVLNPFKAIEELTRMLKVGGVLLVSTPYNFRIHGPLPDCWRFTEHGLRILLSQYNVRIKSLETKNRFLMPIHYTVEAHLHEK